MKVKKITILKEKYPECDITTCNDNFYIKAKDKYILIHNSPAIVFGSLPSDVTTTGNILMKKGDFFVGTKGAFNARPKIAPTAEATRVLYGGELGDIMAAAYTYLRRIHNSGVYQCDLMFIDAEGKKRSTQIIDNIEYLTFKPNTILYAIPTNSNEGRKIAAAQMGIAVHTKYDGPTLAEMKPSFNVSASEFRQIQDVWITDAIRKSIDGEPLLNSEDAKRIDGMGRFIEDNINKVSNEFFRDIGNFDPADLMLIFMNARVRTADKIIDNVDEFTNEFKKWITNRFENEAAAMKTPAGKSARIEKMKRNLDIIDRNHDEFVYLLKAYKIVIHAKNMIVSALNKSSQEIKTFLQTENSLQPTSPEGYCVVSVNDKISKLIDRLEFSRANFQK